MKPSSLTRIIDITRIADHEKYLYRCLAPMPFRKYRNRQEYLEKAIPNGFHKKLLIHDEKVIGQIEYVPARASGYPITGKDLVVMNCIWVLRKSKGCNFGKLLVKDMVNSESDASGFATIGLENHPSPWFRELQMEKLGFKPVDSIRVSSRRKHTDRVFTIYLMWMPKNEKVRPPAWDRQKLLKGETFCIAHPLYHPQTWKGNLLGIKQ